MSSRVDIANDAPNHGAQGYFESVTFNQTQPRNGRSDAILIHDYLCRLYSACNALAFGDPLGGRPGQAMELAEVFTMVEVRTGAKSIDVLADQRECILIGEPGGGKTTVLAYLTLALVEAQPDFEDSNPTHGRTRLGGAWQRETDFPAPFPVRVKLKDVKQSVWDGVPEVQHSDLSPEERDALIALLERRLSTLDRQIDSRVRPLKEQLEAIEADIQAAQQIEREVTIALNAQVQARENSVETVNRSSRIGIDSAKEVLNQRRAEARNQIQTLKSRQQTIRVHLEWLNVHSAVLILDGLDEVSFERLLEVQELIGDIRSRFKHSRIIISCRSFDYHNEPNRHIVGVPVFELARFDPKAQREFVTRWYRELIRTGRRGEGEALTKRDNLEAALRNRQELAALAGTPLLLALISLVHTEEGELPPARALLYHRCVRLLIARWRPSDERTIALDEGRLMTLAAELGYLAHVEEQRQGNSFSGLSRAQVRDTAMQFFERGAKGDAERRQAELQGITAAHRFLTSNGLMLPASSDRYNFAHRTFQEFLAGQYLGVSSRRKQVLSHATESHWRVALHLMAGYGGREGNSIDYLLRLIEQILDRTEEEQILAAEMLLEIGEEPLRDKGYDEVLEEDGLWRRCVLCLRAIAFDSICYPDLRVRIRAANILELLGDDRPEITLQRHEYWATTIEPGIFVMGEGSEEFAFRIDEPFALARFPVTNLQYSTFLNSLDAETAKRHCPHHWTDGRYPSGTGNHPIVGVSWENATTFANWVDHMLHSMGGLGPGESVRLPTEPEWTRAAAYKVLLGHRNPDDRPAEYPWFHAKRESEQWEDRHRVGSVLANTSEAQIGGTSIVGLFSGSAADCGAEELVGNVREWCSSPYKDYPLPNILEPVTRYHPADSRFRTYAICGSSWRDTMPEARLSVRHDRYPDFSSDELGFRLVRICCK